MTYTSRMIDTSPVDVGFDRQVLAECVDACLDCAQACAACADACLGEEMVAELRRCITLDLNCSDICDTTARTLSRHSGYEAAVTGVILEACRVLCGFCAEECERHAEMHEHCRVCAEACRRCEKACDRLLAA